MKNKKAVCVYDDAKHLYYVIRAIGKVTEEALLEFKTDALQVGGVDEAQIAMANLSATKDTFRTYEVHEEVQELGINIKKLKTIFKRAGSKDLVQLAVTEENKIVITLFKEEDGEKRMKRVFNIPLVVSSAEKLDPSNLGYTVEVEGSTDYLSAIIDDFDVIGDTVMLLASRKGKTLTFRSASKYKGEYTHTIDLDEEREIISYNIEKPIDDEEEVVQSTYNTNVLLDMNYTSRLADVVTIRYSSDNPIQLEFLLDSGMFLEMTLAPRVE